MRQIIIHAEYTTPESAAQGDIERSEPNFAEINIDEEMLECDIEDDGLLATLCKAVWNSISEFAMVEPSSSRFHAGVWYSSIDGHTDMRTGEVTRYSFHLKGFSEQEEWSIFHYLQNRNKRVA